MGRRSREKGKRGEREAARKVFIEVWGIPAHRGRQYRGSPDSPDVKHGIEGAHCEVKWDERISPWAALRQAAEDAGEQTSFVLMKRNRLPWIVVLDPEHAIDFASKLLEAHHAHTSRVEQRRNE